MSLQAIAIAEVIQKLKEIELDMGAAIVRVDKALASVRAEKADEAKAKAKAAPKEKPARVCQECGKDLAVKRGRAPKLCPECKQVTLRAT